MSLSVKPGPLHSVVQLPGSKSYANRLLILAALRKEEITISHLPSASDVTFLLKALKQLGLKITSGPDQVTIAGSFPSCESGSKVIEVGEGGTTARFLAAMLLLGKEKYSLLLGERLKERPWQELLDFVSRYGGKASLQDNQLHLQGPVTVPASIEVDCARTTQFASGLSLVFSQKGTSIKPVNLHASQSYWQLTQQILLSTLSKTEWSVPLDWSSASYPMAFAALNHRLLLSGLKYDPLQSDAKFFDILQQFGAARATDSGIEITPASLTHALNCDVSDCLDLVPALAFFLAHQPGQHRLKGVSNLSHKESDRLQETIKLLGQFQRQARVEANQLVITGHQQKINVPVDLTMPDDHRMVMSGTLFLRHHAGGSIRPEKAVEKSYPGFFNLLKN